MVHIPLLQLFSCSRTLLVQWPIPNVWVNSRSDCWHLIFISMLFQEGKNFFLLSDSKSFTKVLNADGWNFLTRWRMTCLSKDNYILTVVCRSPQFLLFTFLKTSGIIVNIWRKKNNAPVTNKSCEKRKRRGTELIGLARDKDNVLLRFTRKVL